MQEPSPGTISSCCPIAKAINVTVRQAMWDNKLRPVNIIAIVIGRPFCPICFLPPPPAITNLAAPKIFKPI